jgi:Phage major capsid protein E
VIDFVLGTPGTDVIGKCQQVWQSISSNLHGEVMRAVEAIVDPTFFGELIEHPNVAKYWLQAEQATSIANMVRVQRQGQMWGRELFPEHLLSRILRHRADQDRQPAGDHIDAVLGTVDRHRLSRRHHEHVPDF